MTNTVEAFMVALDENPALLEAVRVRILTRDLVRLPHTLERYIETTDRRLAALEAGQTRLEKTLERYIETTDRRLAALEAGQTRLEKTLERYIETTDRRLNKIEDDVGELRGFHAEERFADAASVLLPIRMGFRLKATLDFTARAALIEGVDTSAISENDLESFAFADALLVATDPDGVESYVAVEVSYTVHTNDVERAERNARFLTQWTGRPARAAVAGVDLHESAWQAIRNGDTEFIRLRRWAPATT